MEQIAGHHESLPGEQNFSWELFGGLDQLVNPMFGPSAQNESQHIFCGGCGKEFEPELDANFAELENLLVGDLNSDMVLQSLHYEAVTEETTVHPEQGQKWPDLDRLNNNTDQQLNSIESNRFCENDSGCDKFDNLNDCQSELMQLIQCTIGSDWDQPPTNELADCKEASLPLGHEHNAACKPMPTTKDECELNGLITCEEVSQSDSRTVSSTIKESSPHFAKPDQPCGNLSNACNPSIQNKSNHQSNCKTLIFSQESGSDLNGPFQTPGNQAESHEDGLGENPQTYLNTSDGICQNVFDTKSYKVSNNQPNDLDMLGNKISLEGGKYLCTVCGAGFTRKWGLLRHQKSVHLNERQFQCEVCEHFFTEKKSLLTHLRSHLDENETKLTHDKEATRLNGAPFKCDICGEMFTFKNAVKRHILKSHGEKTILSRHKAQVDDNDNHTCSICLKEFSRKSGLLGHQKAVHDKVKPFSCNLCGKSFARKPTLVAHCRTHTGDKPFECQKCEKRFLGRSSLRAHMLAAHIKKNLPKRAKSVESSIACSVCRKKCRDKYDLKRHTKAVHEREKSTKCNVCGKFMSQGLKVHMRTHTMERPFMCDTCGKRFTTNSSLTVHKRIHTGEKPYKCGKCERVFTSYARLYDHVGVHDGTNTCDVCGKEFSFLRGLKNHMKKH